MALKAGFTPDYVRNELLMIQTKAEKKIVEMLTFAGENFVKETREMTAASGGFHDITGNLRSSIGYFVVRDGEIVDKMVYEADSGSDRKTGVTTAENLIKKLASHSGFQLIGMAGMEYASYVEAKGFNVISRQADTTLLLIKKLASDVKI